MPNAAVPAAAAAVVSAVEHHAGTRTVATPTAAARTASVAATPHRLPVRSVHRLRYAPVRLGVLPAPRCIRHTLARIHLRLPNSKIQWMSSCTRTHLTVEISLVSPTRSTRRRPARSSSRAKSPHSSQVSESATGVYEARVAVLRSGTYQVHLSAQAGGLPDDGGPGDDVAPPLPLTVGAAEYVTASSKVRFRSPSSATE